MDDENKRIEIADLPRAEEELSDDEQKGVTGGVGLNVCMGDGSVRNTPGDSPAANKGITIGGARTENV